MERDVKDRNILDDFCIRFCGIIEKHCKYIIVSGFVAISTGRTRGTEDIDMIIERLNLDKFKELHNDLIKNGFVCMQSDNPQTIYDDYLKESISIRYTYKDQPLPEMELKFAKDELDIYQLKTRQKLPITGLDIWFSSIDINIAFKEELLKSDKDLSDSRHLRILFKEQIDEKKINNIKSLIRKYRLK